MSNYRYTLQRKGSKLDCPACGKKKRFVPYIDTTTGQPIHRTVGKCDRESNCGYHYTPKQYFDDNGMSRPQRTEYRAPAPPAKPTDYLPADLVSQSESMQSNFLAFLGNLPIDKAVIQNVCRLYRVGATRQHEVIFWQIDEFARVRTGKIMQYNPTTGKRSKTQPTDWIHSRMIKAGRYTEFTLKQCFFGQHLLTDKAKTIAIVESEKTAIIAACLMPDFIWFAAGQLQGLNIDKCSCLAGRNVVLFPDLSVKQPNRMTAFEVWSAKAGEIMKAYKCKVIVSDLLERKAGETERAGGFDLADYLINDLQGKATAHQERTPKPMAAPDNNTFEKIALFDVGMQILGEQNHLSKTALIDKMVQLYQITDTRAQIGFKSMIDSQILFKTHIDTYCMYHSTPF